MNVLGIADRVAELVPKRYTVTQAASLVGRSPDTIRRWHRNGTVIPSDSKQFGSLTVRLYTDDDIQSLKQAAQILKRGPKNAKDNKAD